MIYLDFCTQDSFSSIFSKKKIYFEVIDKPRSKYSTNNVIKNLEKLVDFLKIKKTDSIILDLRFNEKVVNYRDNTMKLLV